MDGAIKAKATAATKPRRNAGLAALLGAALALLLAAANAAAPAAARDGVAGRPNIIVVMTDDQSVNQMRPQYMPKTMRLLGGKGDTRFKRSFVASPLCCPSRAGFLTGQYPHNDGVFDNTPGYPALIDKDETLFTWLDDAGYRTGHIGRFLLNYDIFAAPQDPGSAPPAPPGVDEWFGYATGPTAYYSAPFSDNGVPFVSGAKQSGYTTRLLNERAQSFIAESAPSADPFFLWLAQLAPHSSNAPPRGNCSSGAAASEPDTYAPFNDEPLPESPSFGERANRDKPTWVQSRPPLRGDEIAALEKGWRCSLAALTSVDRGVANIVRTLRRTGELGNTAIFFTSDNGYLFGEHRIVLEKIYPYEESWRVPLLARIPPAYTGGAKPPRFVKQNVSNLDLTATVLDLADARPCNANADCRTLDGRSFLPLLGAPGAQWPGDRAILAQIGNRNCGVVPTPFSGIKNHYDAIRTGRYKYVEINRVNKDTGACDRPEYELYDLAEDPYELKNLAVNPANKFPSALQIALAERLHALTRCAGAAGRDAPTSGGGGGELPLCE